MIRIDPSCSANLETNSEVSILRQSIISLNQELTYNTGRWSEAVERMSTLIKSSEWSSPPDAPPYAWFHKQVKDTSEAMRGFGKKKVELELSLEASQRQFFNLTKTLVNLSQSLPLEPGRITNET